jgi:hypothetical protein
MSIIAYWRAADPHRGLAGQPEYKAKEVEHWSLTTLREKLVKIGARIVRHGRYMVFQLAELAVPRALFAEILRRIDGLRAKPPPLAAARQAMNDGNTAGEVRP